MDRANRISSNVSGYGSAVSRVRRATLSRRGLLGAGGGLLLGAAGARLLSAAGQREPDEFFEPEVRTSRDGVLETTFVAAEMNAGVAGRSVQSRVYEGTFPGPTLRVRPGDRLRVRLVNRLSTMTNLHVHGLHVSPLGNSDNVLLQIDPGETFQYQFDIPANHSAGLNWYHPHHHGDVTEQVFGGMAGALIIEGELDTLPGIAGLRERLLVLQATEHQGDGALTPPGPNRAQDKFLRLVNGRLNPTIQARPGETQRWRLANASHNIFFRVQLDGHRLHVIGQDGNPVDVPFPREEYLLSPGERVEALIQTPAAGRFSLRSLAFNSGLGSQPETVLATLAVQGEPLPVQPLPQRLLSFVDLRGLSVDRRRSINFQVLPLDRLAPVIPMATFMVNGKQFDADRVDITIPLGGTEEWVLRNATNVWHPFHIHINPFQILSRNGAPLPAQGYKDTVAVPPLGEIVLRTRFLDFTGKYVFHCHILPHEDGGMMSLVETR